MRQGAAGHNDSRDLAKLSTHCLLLLLIILSWRFCRGVDSLKLIYDAGVPRVR